jgi:hypothetical protein
MSVMERGGESAGAVGDDFIYNVLLSLVLSMLVGSMLMSHSGVLSSFWLCLILHIPYPVMGAWFLGFFSSFWRS